MAVEVRDGEKVIYNRDYAKGRKQSVGNVTVTNQRIIHTVESKRGVSKTEINIDEIGGVKVQFKPSSVLLFIVGLLFSVAGGFASLYVRSIGAFEKSDGTLYIPFIIYGVFALFCLIKGLFMIRNGFYVGFYAKSDSLDSIDFISVSANTGKVKPLHLKTKKETAILLQSELSSAIIGAKYKN